VLLKKTPEWKEIQDRLNEELITRTEQKKLAYSISEPS
jgi:hypothetical protein